MNTDKLATVLGCLGAVVIAVKPLIETGKPSWSAVALAAITALFGYITNKFPNQTKQGSSTSPNVTPIKPS